MGCGIKAYWLATLAFDYILYLLSVLILVVVLQIEDLAFVTDYLGKFFLSMALYGLNVAPLSYVWGFAFSKKNTAVKLYPIILYIGFYSLPWAFVNGFANNTTLSHTFEVLFIIISPPFCWSRSLLVFYDGAKDLIKPTPAISSYSLLLTIMSIQAITFFTLTLLLDLRS
jgi:hypothetical protein